MEKNCTEYSLMQSAGHGRLMESTTILKMNVGREFG
jgi:hypothetical protein